jgi:hypothetical protein
MEQSVSTISQLDRERDAALVASGVAAASSVKGGRNTGSGSNLSSAENATGNVGGNFAKPGENNTLSDEAADAGGENGVGGKINSSTPDGSLNKYWVSPMDPANAEDMVVIHVCDETRQISKDFCCKRDILVRHMKYFEKFLQENESGYDDIDISVHCDVEIFEWLMTYIHKPDKPPTLEKSIVVSILISSEFLQMDTLVEHCLVHIANTLNETIRLPIDLSCISDKIINRLAALTHPKALASTKDRKDKILNKLYKRRVELDFSRKSGARGGVRTIAASLTCCRYCGMVYLDNWVSMLNCKKSPLAIDFNGRLVKTHSSIPGWSLTAYLKSLHTAGMNWDAIYWHVWASCQVFQVGDFVVSVIETDRYTIEPDGLLIHPPAVCALSGGGGGGGGNSGGNGDYPTGGGLGGTSLGVSFSFIDDGAAATGEENKGDGRGSPLALPPRPAEFREPVGMCLSADEEVLYGSKWVQQQQQNNAAALPSSPSHTNDPAANAGTGADSSSRPKGSSFKLRISQAEYKTAAAQITPTLNPNRPAEVLPPSIYELICSQTKYIISASNRSIVQKTCQQVLLVAAKTDESESPFNYSATLWGDNDYYFGAGLGPGNTDGGADGQDNERGRSRSPPGREGRVKEKAGKVLSSKSQTRASGKGGSGGSGGNNVGRDSSNSDREGKSRGKRDNSQDSRDSNSSGSGSDADSQAGGGVDKGGGDSDRNNKKGGGKLLERRSRSMGALASNRKGGVGGHKGGGGSGAGGQSSRGLRRVVVNPGEKKFRITMLTEPVKGRQMAMFKNVPPDVVRKLHMSCGSVRGIWLMPHPLQLYPRSFADNMAQVYESNLNANKKHEWAMDLVREFDEKRLDRWEVFLAGRRDVTESNARSPSAARAIALLKQNNSAAGSWGSTSGAGGTASSGKGGGAVDAGTAASAAAAGKQTIADAIKLNRLYYADKGRQPTFPLTNNQ